MVEPIKIEDELILPPLRKPRVHKPKAVLSPGKYDLRKLYMDARKVMFEREYPAGLKDHGHFDNKLPAITTTNGHTRYIEDVLNNLGHHAERVNTGGVPSKATKSGWRHSGSTNGSTDIHCEIKIPSQSLPVGWKIEVKNQDTVLKAQKKYQDKMQRVGVLHSVIRVGELDMFWDRYYEILAL